MKVAAFLAITFGALVSAQGTSPNASISILQVRFPGTLLSKALAGYPELAAFTDLVTGPLANSEYDFVDLLNGTLVSNPLTVFAPSNTAIQRIANHTLVVGLLGATLPASNISLLDVFIAGHIVPGAVNFSAFDSHPLFLGWTYSTGQLPTVPGLNISVRTITLGKLLVEPIVFVQNTLVVQADAIVAQNGVVHIISNGIDPFITAAGGVFGPTKEVLAGLKSIFSTLISLIMTFL
jgi:uncharacterized surface protein with fasciclin (FAS1) repeats